MNDILQRFPALRDALQETTVHLRMAAEGCLLVAVTDDDRLRREVKAIVVERLYSQATFDEYVFDPIYPSLAAYLEALPPPQGQSILFVEGLEALPPEKQTHALHLLNLEREALQRNRRAILLWVRSETLPNLIHQAGDFWAWRSAVLEFRPPPGMEFQPSAPAHLPVQELARLYRFRDAYRQQLASAPPSAPSTADLKLQLAEVQRQLGLPERQVMALRREGLALKAQTGDEEAQVQAYNQFVVDRYGHLTLYSLKANGPLRVELERVYAQLTAVERIQRRQRARERPEEEPEEEERQEQEERPKERDAAVERVLSAQEALAEADRLIVIGAPGSGKTTLLQWIALTFARDLAGERLGLPEHRAPIFVPLRAFGKHIKSHVDRFEPTPACLLDFLEAHFAGWQLNLPQGFFARLADEGRAAFLLDGLDEVADPGRRADVARAVQAFVARYGGNRYVVTSRPAGYTGLAHFGADFQRCDIRPFSDQDEEAFVTNWYLAVETAVEDNLATRQKAAEDSADLLQRIAENDRIRRLVDTPLLLTVVALVHQNRTTLPQRRVKLYDEYTQMLLGFWDEQKGGEAARELARLRGLDRYEKRAILEPVALRFHERREAQEVEGEELRRWLQDEFETLGEPRQTARRRAGLFLRVIQERAGLLVESEPDTYRFSHLTFQEYLAARAVADQEDYVEYTLARRHDSWWREVILLEASHLSTPRSKRARRLTTDLVRSIWKAEEENPLEQNVERILHRNLLLAGNCLADLGPTGVEEVVRDGIVAELGEVLRTTRYSRLREGAAQVLAGLEGSGGVERATTELVQALADGGSGARRAAASSLGQLSQAGPEMAQVLIKALTDDAPDVRQAAASGIVQLAATEREVALHILLPAFSDSTFEKLDLFGRPAYDYAFDALWAIAGISNP